MAFGRKAVRTPTSIGRIAIRLVDPAGEAQTQQAHASVEILDETGAPLDTWQGDLVPHLTEAQINGLLGFMAAMRAKAIAEILPD